MQEIRFSTGFLTEATDEPGLVLALDGRVWLVNPDGSRTQLPGGGGGGCEYFTCDTDQEIATMSAPNAAVVEGSVVGMGATGVVGGAPNVGATVQTDGGLRALYEVGIGGTADEQAYVNMSAQGVEGNKSASIDVRGDDGDEGLVALSATDRIAAVAPVVISTARSDTEGVGGQAIMNAQGADPSPYRGSVEVSVSGATDETSYAFIAAQNRTGGGTASIRAEATDGGDTFVGISGEKLTFLFGDVPPVARREIDPATLTTQDIGDILIELGLCLPVP